jgi:uroporphyrinogen-III synthase
MGALNTLSILVPESRELDLFAGMMEAQGARAHRCPLVQIAQLEDKSEAEGWIDRFIAMPPDDLVLLTGDGLRQLIALSGARRGEFLAALGRTRIVTRGPKPARALREVGLLNFTAAAAPTSPGVLETLEGGPLQGRRIAIQLYPGDGAQWIVQALTERGVTLDIVTPYRYANQSENEAVAQIIRALIGGRIGMVAFTATPQLARLLEVAKTHGLEAELRAALARLPIAAVGPVMEEALAAQGLKAAITPKSSFHMKPMVRAICEAWPLLLKKAAA